MHTCQCLCVSVCVCAYVCMQGSFDDNCWWVDCINVFCTCVGMFKLLFAFDLVLWAVVLAILCENNSFAPVASVITIFFVVGIHVFVHLFPRHTHSSSLVPPIQVSVSEYPLSASLVCSKVCQAFEDKWEIV